jgi:hypothetical protein
MSDPAKTRLQPARSGRLLLLGGLLAVSLTLVTSPVAAAEFTREVSLDADQLEVTSLIGEVRIEPAAGDRFEITIAVQGKDADPDLITIEVQEGRQARLEVRFPVDQHRSYVYPGLAHGGRATIRQQDGQEDKNWLEKLLGGLGNGIEVRRSGQGLEVWADVTVKVPRERLAEVRNGVGKISATAVDAELSLYLKNGPIEVREHRGPLLCDIGSGSVKVQGVEGPLSVDTGSGSVAVADQRGDKLHVDTGSGGVTIDRADTGLPARRHRQRRGQGARDPGRPGQDRHRQRRGDPRAGPHGRRALRDRHRQRRRAPRAAGRGLGHDHRRHRQRRHQRRRVRRRGPAADRGELKLRVGEGTAKVSIDTGSGGVKITGP